MNIGLLHYSGPPTVGGVEQTLYYHAKALADHGHRPRLFVGQGQGFDPRVPVTIISTLYSRHPDVLAAKAALDTGIVDGRFDHLCYRICKQLEGEVSAVDILIVHNVLTLHKNLALTAALWQLVQNGSIAHLIGWHHDFAWDRSQYHDELHKGFPWDLLRNAWPEVTNVVVSEAQRDRLAQLYRISPNSIHVIPPGIDPAITGNWTDLTRRLVAELGLMEADSVLLLPARITRRKNIEFGLQILAALREFTNRDIRLVITGPPGPHNPTNAAYLESLFALGNELDLEGSAHFLYQLGWDDAPGADKPTMANLFHLCDALIFPSHEEGFGIPILEAGLARLPIFCSDIPPFHESASDQAHYFSLSASPHEVAETIAKILLTDPAVKLRRRVRSMYTWEKIITDKLLPLVGGFANA